MLRTPDEAYALARQYIDEKFKSPVFTGTPKAPTAAEGTATDQIATTKFVSDAIGDYGNVAKLRYVVVTS